MTIVRQASFNVSNTVFFRGAAADFLMNLCANESPAARGYRCTARTCDATACIVEGNLNRLLTTARKSKEMWTSERDKPAFQAVCEKLGSGEPVVIGFNLRAAVTARRGCRNHSAWEREMKDLLSGPALLAEELGRHEAAILRRK
ncbi:hypothetical protein DL766_001786 [Monosporascus sp. MC13-8B]|nr:hypothetical protein DL763_001489 [Monosporascus cannonballus]RYP36908.1 hypothetical protein DL766_001786 [Monosporascus sp. MC13-8B]